MVSRDYKKNHKYGTGMFLFMKLMISQVKKIPVKLKLSLLIVFDKNVVSIEKVLFHKNWMFLLCNQMFHNYEYLFHKYEVLKVKFHNYKLIYNGNWGFTKHTMTPNSPLLCFGQTIFFSNIFSDVKKTFASALSPVQCSFLLCLEH